MASRAKLSKIIIIIPLILTFSLLGALAAASDSFTSLQTLTWDLEKTLLAKAQPDECFKGMGMASSGAPPCGEGYVPKVNQAYVWGLTYANHKLWFGTVANTECLVLGQVLGPIPIQSPTWVCEYGNSHLVPPLPPAVGDWRPPKIYSYDLKMNTLTDRTANLPLPAMALINGTTGLRSAGTVEDVVFVAGPGLVGGVNFFAFKGSDGTFLGAKSFPVYNDIRRWLVVEGVLYCGVGKTGGGGAVLRWTGNATNPFQFEEVGIVSDPAADLAYHEGRIFVHTWPGTSIAVSGHVASLIMGPVVPAGGLTTAHANPSLWVSVWKASDYEPDPVTATTYAGGALKSSGGYLYWGTMHVPFAAAQAALKAHSDLRFSNAFIGTMRAIALFRGKNFGSKKPTLELLYGEQYLPVWDSALNSYTTATDAAHQNKMPNPVPKYGKSGFGNPYNTYTWSMEIYKGKLYVGTFDWTYLADQYVNGQLNTQPSATIAAFLSSLPQTIPGADLYRFENNGSASMVSNDGIGNLTNYGVRNMLVVSEALYLGMANPMNLATDPSEPQGGWELIKLLIKAKH